MPLKSFLFFTITCLISLVLHAADIDVTKSGAVADGKTVNTVAIQKAIDECSKQGGGKVIFPAGTWVSGTILLKDNVHLFLHREAILLGSTDINDYLLVEGFKDGRGSSLGYSFIGGKDAKNIGITGKGKVNGNGKLLLEKNGRSKRPFLVRFVRCTDVTVSDVQLEGPAAWTMHWFECKKIRAERVVIGSRGLSNNEY
jgi:polygalacturonase